jgi:hypothetical protein
VRTLGHKFNCDQTLKGLGGWRTLSGFKTIYVPDPRVVATLQPWAEISERLRRNFKLMHHSFVAEGDTINLRAYTSVHVEKLSANLSTERPTL